MRRTVATEPQDVREVGRAFLSPYVPALTGRKACVWLFCFFCFLFFEVTGARLSVRCQLR